MLLTLERTFEQSNTRVISETGVSFQGSILISVGGCVLATKVCFLDKFRFQLIFFASLISAIV